MDIVNEQSVREILEARGFRPDESGKYRVPFPVQYFGGSRDNRYWYDILHYEQPALTTFLQFVMEHPLQSKLYGPQELEQKLDQLHGSIHLDAQHPMASFRQFVTEYLLQPSEKCMVDCLKAWGEKEFLTELYGPQKLDCLDGHTHLDALGKITELLDRLVIFDYSEELLLSSPVRTVIRVDTGDSAWEYTANTVYPAYGPDHLLKDVEDIASIVWLTKQQGHKKGELYYALDNIKFNPGSIRTEFMRSLAEEVWHTLSDYTPLCFFLTLPVYDLLLLRSLALWSKRSQKWGGYLVLTPETPTGFYTEVVGSCSLTKIHLEKPVKLPMKYMAEAMPDFAYHYPFSHFASFDKWDKGAISYISMPKGFRRVMEEYGLRPVRKNVQY